MEVWFGDTDSASDISASSVVVVVLVVVVVVVVSDFWDAVLVLGLSGG